MNKKNKKVHGIIGVCTSTFTVIYIILNLCLLTSLIITPNFQSPKSSGIWATLDLTNPIGINNTRHPHNSLINIQGRLYNRITDEGKSGYRVAIEVNDVIDSNFDDYTDFNGDFQIDYTVDPSLSVYMSHIIEVTVLDPTPDTVEYRTHYLIYVNTTSYFEISGPTDPKLIGETLNPEGYLRYEDATGIPFANINYNWYNGPVIIDSNTVQTDGSGDIQTIPIPDIGITNLELLLYYQSPPEVGYSENLIVNTRLFSNISCIWDLDTPIRAQEDIRIAGRIVSSNNPSLSINDRTIEIWYHGNSLGLVQTGSNGQFSHTLEGTNPLANYTGLVSITIRLQNGIGKNIETSRFITVQPPVTQTGPGVTIPPMVMFFSIFLPILGIVLGVLGFFGYRYYKRMDKESKVVNLPLEDKILNLKMLKESGRLEECLSYLFNAIYLDLINAKYGRTRKENETIRDFAIVSVKELRLTPTSIYPFIQKVEEVIYARPYQITENDFYNTVELFSPIYFELTGYNFVLNF